MRAVYVDRSLEMRDVMERRQLTVPRSLIVNDGTPAVSDLVRLGSEADVLIVERTVIPPAVLDACPSLHSIIFMGTGAESYIDLADSARRGIRILTTPGYGDRTVAEHTMALLFAGARNIARMDREVRSGQWASLGGIQLAGRKLAVVGLGGIGTVFAQMALALGLRVCGWNRTPRQQEYFVSDLDTALRAADVVSLHLSLNEETRGILDRRRIGLLNRGCILVNTARAQLVDEDALLGALADGQIGHSALDVFPLEPLPPANPYRALSNVTLTAHAAYLTEDACAQLWLRTLKALSSAASAAGD